MLSRRSVLFAWVVASLASATSSEAQESPKENACDLAFNDVDPLLQSGSQLLEAREKLRACSASTCKEWMIKDCTTKLVEVEARIPTVVFAAKDDAGDDVSGVVVSVAERPIADRLDGVAIELNPGEYVFLFHRPDGRREERRAILREGEKARVILATFDRAATAERPVAAAPKHEPPPRRSNAMRIGAIAAGAAGVVGIGIGAVFGVKALSRNGTAQCDENDVCLHGDARLEAKRFAHIADAAFVAGGILAAGAVVLFITSPSGGRPVSLQVGASPFFGGLALKGGWR